MRESSPKTIFFSVGEPSGDLHGANLIRSLREVNPDIECRGFGGQRMLAAGLDCDFDLTQLAVVGITEVIPRLPEFFRLADQAEQIFRRGDVQAVVLVDFPGFNWHVARRAKRHGIPVYYYLPPQMWAWAGWRVRKMRRYVEHCLCNLPFELDWYRQRGVSCSLVGHPFFDEVASAVLDARFIRRWREPERMAIGILPGSRDGEVHRNWPLQLEVIRRLHALHPTARFLVAGYRDRHVIWCREQMSEADQRLPMHFFVGKTSEIIEVSDVVLTKSGSVSLELMARGTPAVVVYSVSRLVYSVGRLLVSAGSITLPNLIAGQRVLPEFVCVGAPERTIVDVTEAMDCLMRDAARRGEVQTQLLELAKGCGGPGSSLRVAQFLNQRLASSDVTSVLPGPIGPEAAPLNLVRFEAADLPAGPSTAPRARQSGPVPPVGERRVA
jgi:lipid-A-disaccharide synthase